MAVMDYVNELKNQRNLLTDILTEKGVAASRSEKFNTLIPKVRDISGGGTCGGIQFSDYNLLTDITFFDSDYATTVKNGNIVTVTFNSTSDVTWYTLTSAIPFDPKKFYKLTVNNWNGFGRLGISNVYQSSFSNDNSKSPYGYFSDKTGLNATGNFQCTGFGNDGDNNVMSENSHNDKLFKIIPSTYNQLTTNGSLWICTDELYNDLRESFSIELALYEQI